MPFQTKMEQKETARLLAFQEARSQKTAVDLNAALAWKKASFSFKRTAGHKIRELFRKAQGGTGKRNGLLLDSGHTWLGRLFLDAVPIWESFGHLSMGMTAGGHQLVSWLLNPLSAGAGRSLTNVLVGMQADTPQLAANIKNAGSLPAITKDMRSSREELEKINAYFREQKDSLMRNNKAKISEKRVEAVRPYLAPTFHNPQDSPLMRAVLKADGNQQKYPARMDIAKLNWQSRRHVMLISFLDGIMSAVSFVKAAALGSIVTKMLINPLYVLGGHYDFKTKIQKTLEYNAKHAEIVKEESRHKPIEDLTKDDIDPSLLVLYRNKANTRAAFIEIMASEDLGKSFLKLEKLQRECNHEMKEKRRLILMSRIKEIQKERNDYKRDLKILRSKCNYASLSLKGKIRACILHDAFYIKEATLALLKSPGIFAGDFFQRLSTTAGEIIPGVGHILGTTHDVPAVADALGVDGSAVTTSIEETNSALSTATQRDHKAGFKPLSTLNIHENQPRDALKHANFHAWRRLGGRESKAEPIAWPEEDSAKSSAAYKTLHTRSARFFHNIKGLGKFFIAAPTAIHNRNKAQKERASLMETLEETRELCLWFAGKNISGNLDVEASTRTREVPETKNFATITNEIKSAYKELHKKAHPHTHSLKDAPARYPDDQSRMEKPQKYTSEHDKQAAYSYRSL